MSRHMQIRPSQKKWRKYDFGGPLLNLLIMLALPIIVYYLYFAIRFNGGMLLPARSVDYSPYAGFLASIIPTWKAVGLYLGWFCFQALLQALLPARKAVGKPLPDGSRLSYPINGLLSFVVTISAVILLVLLGRLDTAVIYDNLGALISVVMIFSLVLSVFLFIRKSRSPRESSGSRIHDFYMGRYRNPRIGNFDLKFFCEARPGLLLWVLINASYIGMQYRMYGRVSNAMVLVNLLQLWYIIDYYLHEEAILTTMDIAYENFGFMLAFGDLAWVPFTYSLQALFLVRHPINLPWWAIVIILVVNLSGYLVFRQVNLQKHRFSSNPDLPIWGKKPEFIQTRRGTKLLASGFWSWSRHFNYVGDILMALAWSLPTLFSTPLTYFYPIYMTILLIHRERRDNKHCAMKYGDDWDRYCEKVPWRILPGVY